ncbi:MAG: hypothetical protein IJ248_00410 [Candidatus Methanomethylophilaceae archaeon]|nr:hypothetical protein [Candidatus Methanomethylophilaceae archaeon]
MSRYSKAVTSILVFYLSGLGIWFLDALMAGPLSLQVIIPLVIAVIGTVSTIQSMRGGMRDMLSSEAFFFGIYLLSRGIIIMITQRDLGFFAYGMVLIIMGPLMILFASSLWAGFDYNNFRIRNICYAVMAIAGTKLFLTFLFAFNHDGIIYMLMDFLTIIVALNIVIFSMDRSVSQSSLMQSIRESTDSMSALLYNVNDAYILGSGCQEVQHLIDSDQDGQVRLKLLSNQIRNRMLIFTKTDGKLRADLHATDYVHANPLYMMDVRDVVIGERYLTVYSHEGRWFRLLIYENLQEDYTKAKIFGQVIDFDLYLRRYSYHRLLKKNIREQEDERKEQE